MTDHLLTDAQLLNILCEYSTADEADYNTRLLLFCHCRPLDWVKMAQKIKQGKLPSPDFNTAKTVARIQCLVTDFSPITDAEFVGLLTRP